MAGSPSEFAKKLDIRILCLYPMSAKAAENQCRQPVLTTGTSLATEMTMPPGLPRRYRKFAYCLSGPFLADGANVAAALNIWPRMLEGMKWAV